MGETGRTLTPSQQRAIAALLESRTAADAAKLAKVGQTTLYRWMADPVFLAALRAAEGQLLDDATRRLLCVQGLAIDALEDVLRSQNASDALRVQAARVVLDALLKVREAWQVEQRLAVLEAALTDG